MRSRKHLLAEGLGPESLGDGLHCGYGFPLEGSHPTFSSRFGTTDECPICAAPAEFWCRAADHHYDNPGMWDVYRCSDCGHLFQHPVPKEEDLVQFYPASYYAHQQPTTDFAPRGVRHRGVWLRLHYLKYFRAYRHLTVSNNPILGYLGYLLCHRPLHFDSPTFQPGGVFLDYGSGAGNAVAFAQYVGWTAEGIEINSGAVKAGRDSGINVDHGTIDTLEDRAGRYDYIMSSHCIEHVPDVRRLFRAFFLALKPGGMLAIDVPNGDSVAAERFREVYYYLGMPVHAHLFTPSSIHLLAQSTGFIDMATATYSRWSSQVASTVLIRRSRSEASPGDNFHSCGRWERLLGRIKSLPTYIQSQVQSRGDCLIMTCAKPSS